MDTNTIFTKTAKGAGAAAGKSKALTRDERTLLHAIDGQSSVGMLAQQLGLSEARLQERLAPLVAADYIRAFVALDDALDSELDPAQLPVLEDAMGAATIFAFLQETERQAQQAAEDRLSGEMERQSEQDADEQAQREAEELARRKETVARIRQEALEKYRRDLARQEAEKAEEQCRLQAGEEARLAAQKQARRDAEEQARRAAEQRLRDEAEALARQHAAEQARREAEVQARREAGEEALLLAERMRREQEQRERRDAAHKAEREAAEQAKRAERELARKKAEERAHRKADQKARRAARAKELREQALAVDAAIGGHVSRSPTVWSTENTASLLALDVPADAAAVLADAAPPEHRDAFQSAPAAEAQNARAPEPVLAAANNIKHYRKPSRWRVPVALTLAGAVAAGIVWAQTLPFDGRRMEFEQQAGAAFGQPVKIGQVRLAWLPLPHWRIEDVAIGAKGQIRVAQVDAVARLDTLFDRRAAYHSVTLQAPVVDEEGLGWLLFGKARSHAIALDNMVAHRARLASPRIDLPPFEIDAVFGRDGSWTSAALHNAERQLRIDLRPQGEAIAVDLRADAFASAFGAFGGNIALDQFSASGHATRNGLVLSTVNGNLHGGSISGNARLQWNAGWTLDGTFKAHRIDAVRLAPQMFESGKLDGRAEVAWEALEAGRLFAAPRIKGEAGVRNGVLRGVDLAGVARNGDHRGKTAFADLDGAFMHDRGRLQLRSLRLGAGLLSAGGSADLDASGKLAGRFVVDLKASARQARGHVGLNGTLAQPRFE
jgi:hypothetical protein